MGERWNPFKPVTEENKLNESHGREWLLSLEKTSNYVFHGSSDKIESELEPRQAVNNGKIHGEPGVSATQFAEIAIFRAIINRKNFPDGYETQFGISQRNEKETPEYKVSNAIFEKLKTSTAKGYVYVFEKGEFEKFEDSKWEVRAKNPLKPIHVIEVSIGDLPEQIESFDKKIISPELSYSSNELDYKFKNITLNKEMPKSPELKVTFQKEPMDFIVGKSYGPMSEVLFDGKVTEKMEKLLDQAAELKNLPEEKRLAPLLELLRENIKYPFVFEIDDLKKTDSERAEWVEKTFAKEAVPQHIPLSEIFEKGYGICSHLSVAYLWLAKQIGLEGTCAQGSPKNVLRVDNGEPLFKNSALDVNVRHMWVEIQLENKQWIPVDPSTKLIGDTSEGAQTFNNASYVGIIGNEITITKTSDSSIASIGSGPIFGFKAGSSQTVENIFIQLMRDAFSGKVPDGRLFSGSVDLNLKIRSPLVTSFKIKEVTF